jgi:hypothetical protein
MHFSNKIKRGYIERAMGRPRKYTVVWADDYGNTINIVFDKADCVKTARGDTHVKLSIEQGRIVKKGITEIIGESRKR